MIFLALIIAGLKFPFIARGPDLSGIPADTWPRIREPGRWIQWFTKCFAFLVEVYTVAIVLWALL